MPTTQPTSQGVRPDSDQLPTVQQVIDRYADATGGRAAYATITSRTFEGIISFPAQGLSGKMTAQVSADGGRVDQVIDNIVTVGRGITKGIAWELNTLNGPRIIEGIEAQALKRQLTLNTEITVEDYKSSVVTGVEKIDGVDAYVIDLVDSADSPERRFYDTQSGLLLKTETVVKEQGSEFRISTRYGDYQLIAPVKMPLVMVVDAGAAKMEIRITSMQHNVEIPADSLEIPVEIKSLIDSAQRATSGPAETTAPAQ